MVEEAAAFCPVATDRAPAAIGPYSQGVVAGDLVFCSGQIGLAPATGVLVAGGIEAETRRVLENLGAVLAAAGARPGDPLADLMFALVFAGVQHELVVRLREAGLV